MTSRELRRAGEVARLREALRAAQAWHNGDKWRFGTIEQRKRWGVLQEQIEAALSGQAPPQATPAHGEQIDIKDIARGYPNPSQGDTITAPREDDLPPKPWIPCHVFKWGAPVRGHDFIHDGIGDKHSGRCQAYVQAGPMAAICSRPFDAHRCVDHGCGEPFSRHPAPHPAPSPSAARPEAAEK